jgi:putative nucleotidyltransferase with HDIG domain
VHPIPRKRVLVVDDEEYVCRVIVESLSQENFDIVSFIDPAKAMEHLAGNPVDLVLTDLVMGEYSGLQILETTLTNHPDAAVILMTAHPTVQTAISVLKQGAYDFLVKPFKLELLKATISRCLDHQKALRDNLSLKGQVEFLKVANAFFGSGMNLDEYLELVLRSCNTELSAVASAVIEIDPNSGTIIRRVHKTEEGHSSDEVLDDSLLDQFRGTRSASVKITTEPVSVDGRQMSRILISKPIFIRRKLHGVFNILTLSLSDTVPLGQLDALCILAGSAASAIANQKLYEDVRKAYLQAIRALANAIEARDKYTAGHTDRVDKLAELIARQIGWSDAQIETLHMGCALHDIGKIGVPDSILNKSDILTDDERRRMMKHPQLGLRIIRGHDLLKPSIPFIIAHHERYDGKGYPKGLKGEDIPLEGRLLAVADTFDAIVSDRPYRKGATLAVAIRELIAHKGTQFDPMLVDAFLEVLRAGKIDFRQWYGRDEDLTCVRELISTETVPA